VLVGDAPPPVQAGCWLFEGQRLAREDDVRVETAFSGLVDLLGVWVRDVSFEPGRVRVEVALRRRRLVCPECEYSTRARKDTRPGDTVWRHLDLGVWRLEICCRRRRLWCPVHGARAEGVPFARPGSEFTCDFECLVAWLAARTEKTTITRMLGIDWGTVGQIIRRVCADELDPDPGGANWRLGRWQQHRVAGGPLDQGADRADVLLADDQVALCVPSGTQSAAAASSARIDRWPDGLKTREHAADTFACVL
jgi:hypothetical protein